MKYNFILFLFAPFEAEWHLANLEKDGKQMLWLVWTLIASFWDAKKCASHRLDEENV